MTEREPRLWIGDSHTLDRPSDDDIRDFLGPPVAKEEDSSSSATDAH